MTGSSGCGSAGLGAFRARIILIIGIFLQAFIKGVTHLGAARTNEIDSLDCLIDSLAIEDAALELLDANPQQFLVLTLNFAAASLILGQVGVFVSGIDRLGEPVQITLRGFGLMDFRHVPAAPPSPQTADKAAIFLAHEKETPPPVTGEQCYLTLGATIGAEVLMLGLGGACRSSRFFFGHVLPVVQNLSNQTAAHTP
jgi:hypothetical protein